MQTAVIVLASTAAISQLALLLWNRLDQGAPSDLTGYDRNDWFGTASGSAWRKRRQRRELGLGVITALAALAAAIFALQL